MCVELQDLNPIVTLMLLGSGPILKTSPSPTGSKSPPSINTSPTQGGRTVLSGQQPHPPVTKPVVQQHKPTPVSIFGIRS